MPDGVEGFYELHIRGEDAFGNQSGIRTIWRGVIDTNGPRVLFNVIPIATPPLTEYAFQIDDLFLDETTLVHPCAESDLIRNFDPNSGRLNQITARCSVPGEVTESVSLSACDIFGRCAAQVTVPNVVGLSRTEAETLIASAGLNVGSVTTALSANFQPGQIVSHDPPGNAVRSPGASVDLVASLGLVVPPGDVDGLRFAINEANANGIPNTIELASGSTYLLDSALPEINSELVIEGNGATLNGDLRFQVLWVNFGGGDLTINNLNVTGGSAPDGGGLRNNGGILRVSNSAIFGNSALDGAGIYSAGGVLEVTNSTISGNVASRRGGGIVASSVQTIWSSTVVGNSSPVGEGGGIRRFGPLEIANTIVANNGPGGDCAGFGTLTSRFSIDSDGTCNLTGAGNQSSTDPMLGPLQDNGGPTLTHALLVGSPAIDAGDPAGCSDQGGDVLLTDQRGFSREAPTGACDIGAYESGAPFLIPDGDVSALAAAIASTNANGVPDTIELFPGSNYLLVQALPEINDELVIEGNGATLNGDLRFQVLWVNFGGGDLTINNLNVTGGSAPDGGGLRNNGGILRVLNSAIFGNSALDGAGIYSAGGVLEVTNSTISGNIASRRGGGLVASSVQTIWSSTVVGNTSPAGEGGGIRTFGPLDMANTIVANNGPGGDCAGFGALTSRFSMDSDGTCNLSGTGDQPNTGPGLGPLRDNGGPTFTHALLPGSLAIDAGDPAGCTDSVGDDLTTDQRGLSRLVGLACDVGAYESADTDRDGVAETVEEAAPNGGDGNNDGAPDSQQGNVASLPNTQTQEYVTLVSPDGTSLGDVTAVGNPSSSDAPADVDFPIGFFDFTITGLSSGVTTVEVFVPDGVTMVTYYKYGPTPDNVSSHWYEFLYDGATGAEIFDDDNDGDTERIVLHFVDGLRGDDDLIVNGIIVDPGAPGVLSADDTPPSLSVPAPITVEGDTTGGASALNADIAAFLGGASSTDAVDPSQVITNDAPPFFDLDVVTVVTFTATDASGNVATSSSSVTVEDTTAPELAAPAAIAIEGDTTGGASALNADIAAFLGGASSTDAVDPSPVITNDAPAFFDLDVVTVVTFTATDASGNFATSSSSVTVVDATAPELTAPASIAIEGDTTGGASALNADIAAFLNGATAADAVDPAPVITNDAPPFFDLDVVTVVTFTATDASGNSATSSSSVTVEDAAAPSLSVPAAITVEGDTTGGASALNADIAAFLNGATAADAVDPAPVITNDAPPFFDLDVVTVVTFTATDASGNSATSSSSVTVVDTTDPTITAPADIAVEANTTGGATGVALGAATASDIADPAPSITNDAPATFLLGTTVVTWTATDASGNSADATQNVTVVDTTDPSITAPADLTVEANTTGGATGVALGVATASDIADPAPVITNNAPVTFLLGTTVVTWTTTDANGNSTNATQDVTVVDTTDPSIAAPADLTVEANTTGGATGVALGAATASDIADPAPAISNDAPVTFVLGTTVVTWTATDANGNSATATQNVTIVDSTTPEVTAELVPVPGKVDDNQGEFIAQFSCADIDDVTPLLRGVIIIPSVIGLDLKLKVKPEIKVVFDLEDGKVKIEGPDPESVLLQIINLGGLIIDRDQRIKVDLDGDENEMTFKFDKKGVLKNVGSLAHLAVTCVDSSGNVGLAFDTSELLAKREDDDEGSHDDDAKSSVPDAPIDVKRLPVRAGSCVPSHPRWQRPGERRSV